MNRNEGRAQTENGLRIVMINDRRFAVEERNGNISFNLTMMAKPFGKVPKDWRKTDETQRYLEALTERGKIPLADLLEVRKGGVPHLAGTWANDYRIAMRFAQWLDPDFAIAVDELVFNVLTKQVAVAHAPSKHGIPAIIYEGRVLYPYRDVVRALGGSARSHASRRRARLPHHFEQLYGRNFVTSDYVDLLACYYRYRQLSLDFGLSDKGGVR